METNQGFDITYATEQWRLMRDKRLELENIAKKIKDGPEAEHRAAILMYLDGQGLTGAKVSQGTISRTVKQRVEIADTEVVCRYMYDQMTQALQEGRPLSDALIMQKTAHKGAVTEIVKDKLGLSDKDKVPDDVFNTIAIQLGMRAVSTPDISFSKK